MDHAHGLAFVSALAAAFGIVGGWIYHAVMLSLGWIRLSKREKIFRYIYDATEGLKESNKLPGTVAVAEIDIRSALKIKAWKLRRLLIELEEAGAIHPVDGRCWAIGRRI